MKTLIKIVLGVIIAGMTVASIATLASKSIEAKADCSFIDTDFNYVLICVGESGSCKFINPNGASIICDGNKAITVDLDADDDEEEDNDD